MKNLLLVDIFKVDPLSSMHYAIKKAEEELVNSMIILVSFILAMTDVCSGSGTTAIAFIIRGHKLYAINVGDSRFVYDVVVRDRLFILLRTQTQLVAENITKIHCPDHEAEKKRIEQNGGHIRSTRTFNSYQSISRVFGEDGNIGGLAMSRSVGDTVLHRYGVISEPDLYERDLSDDTVGLLLGSDGLTTSFGMSKCFRVILSEASPQLGLRKLMSNCYRSMYEESQHTYVDDISGVYVQIRPVDMKTALEVVDRIPHV